jgi:hypothetical protein
MLMLFNEIIPVQGGVDGNLQLSLPPMNRLNQTEPALLLSLQDFYFCYVCLSIEILLFSISIRVKYQI